MKQQGKVIQNQFKEGKIKKTWEVNVHISVVVVVFQNDLMQFKKRKTLAPRASCF